MKQVCFFLQVFLLLFLLSSCNTEPASDNSELKNTKELEKRFTLGGAPVEVFVGISDKEIDLTEYFTITIKTIFKEGVQITPPYLSEAVYSPLLLIENPKESTHWSEKHGSMVNEWTYRFEPVSSGNFSLKPFDINFRLNKEKTDDLSKWPIYQIKTDIIEYSVKSVSITDEDDIRDLKDLILPEYNFIPVTITLSVLILISLGFWFFLKYKNILSGTKSEQSEEIDYYVEALKQLDELESLDLINQEMFSRFHTRLSAILRNYVEYYFGLHAKEQTTEEFIRYISTAKHFSLDQQAILNRFLSLADLVKFATFDPGSKTSEDAMKNVRTFITTTGKADGI